MAAKEGPPRIEWHFDADSKGIAGVEGSPTRGWKAVQDVRGLAIRDGSLVGEVGKSPILVAPGPDSPDPNDSFHSLELKLRTSKGTRLGVSFVAEEKLDERQLVEDAKQGSFSAFNLDLRPGDRLETYTVTAAQASFNTSYPLPQIRHVALRFIGAEGARIEIASMRLLTLKEHLAAIPSGVGWHGLSEVFRETIVTRAPESVSFPVDLPSRPWLDLAIGTVDNGPVTFHIAVDAGGGVRRELQKRTVSTPNRWESVPVELGAFARRRVQLVLSVEAEREGTPGFWGAPVVRNRGGRALAGEPSPARAALMGGRLPPQGVILIIADTLRRDHLPPWGYDRKDAPVLSRLAREGALFQDNIAQGAWTKVSVSSIITSLYPTTNGIRDMPDRIPAGVTTLAEAYRTAGYATFATSSVPFTGRLTNLHHGVEVLHEATSLPDRTSKTSRTYVDRLLEWVELHREAPFFAFLHIFDPHSPFEPYHPYDNLWMSPQQVVEHRKDMEKAKKFIESDFFKREGLANPAELRKAGVDQDRYLADQKAWYDSSIRAMDVEIGRLVERLQDLHLDHDTVIAFASDHGEEFLEHGRPFHGYTAYGEILNVPMVLSWSGALPEAVVKNTVENLDLMPTLLDLSQLPLPKEAQGQSLLPLLAGQDPAKLGWTSRPAFAERHLAPVAMEEDKQPTESWAIVDGEWKLIKNGIRPAGRPEFELYDHRKDPINLHDVAAEHPEVVKRLAGQLDAWHQKALAARVKPDAGTAEVTSEERERLRALGYLQ